LPVPRCDPSADSGADKPGILFDTYFGDHVPVSYHTIVLVHSPFVFLWLSCLFLTLIFAAISWLQASKGLPADGMAIVRFTTIVGLPCAAVVLITGLMLFATGQWPKGDGYAMVGGTMLLLIVTIPGTALAYSAAQKLLRAATGSDNAITSARRIMLICGVQFVLILIATLRGLNAAGKL
jgi:hypothetical protein